MENIKLLKMYNKSFKFFFFKMCDFWADSPKI